MELFFRSDMIVGTGSHSGSDSASQHYHPADAFHPLVITCA